MNLTKQQMAAYRFIRQYIAINEVAPTEKEIAIGIGNKATATGAVHRHVMALVEAGYLYLEPNKKRNIRLVKSTIAGIEPTAQCLPLYGSIAAGTPVEAVAGALDYEDARLDLSIISQPGRFALHVKGDSMIGDNICDGDYVICESCESAGNGDIVVVLVDREDVTLKRIQRNQGGTVSLVPSNPAMDAMVYDVNRVSVQGRYLGLLRLHH